MSAKDDKKRFKSGEDGRAKPLRRPVSLRSQPEEDEPKLYLEREPEGRGTTDDYDEMVPDFMHRDFYRSTDGEIDAIAARPRLDEKRPKEPITSLRTPEKKSTTAALEDLTPLRAASSKEELPQDETVSVPLESLVSPEEPQEESEESEKASSFPRPVSTSNLNIPLVTCLLLLVGLFLWREQTRPVLPPAESELPVPRVVKLGQDETALEDDDLSEESPYPGMNSEEEAAPIPEAPVESAPSIAPEEPSVAEVPIPEESDQGGMMVDHASESAAAQRAAILDRMSERTVSNNERDSRQEQTANPAAPSDTSLFPSMEGEDEQGPWDVPDATEATDAEPAETEAAAIPEPAEVPDSDSLFPEEGSAVTNPSEEVPIPGPAEAAPPPISPGQGEPYQIAEPDL